jgi:hypothetical protein
MNWIHFNTKSLKRISKLKVNKPDVVSIALSIAQISNDFYGASWASDINKELTTRMVAREWLNIWFRSGFNQKYMNMLINNNSIKLTGNQEQIEAIALKLGSTGALCDTYEFFNPFYECTGIENINYDYDKVITIITDKLSKANALYRNIVGLTGSLSNERAEIGTVGIDWLEDAEFEDFITSPVNLKAALIDNDHVIHISWDKVKEAVSYEVLWASKETPDNWNVITNLQAEYYDHALNSSYDTYNYKVIAINKNGIKSYESSVVSITFGEESDDGNPQGRPGIMPPVELPDLEFDVPSL